MFARLIVAAVLVAAFDGAIIAQESNIQSKGKAIDQNTLLVESLEKLVEGKDPVVAKAALRAIIKFCDAKNPSMRLAAQNSMDDFNKRAIKWLAKTPHRGIVLRPTLENLPDIRGFTFTDIKLQPKNLLYLEAFSSLKHLVFDNVSGISDKDLIYLDDLRLEVLTLENMEINGEGFNNLSLPLLSVFYLTQSNIDDGGIKNLDSERFPSLKSLVLSETRISDVGLMNLELGSELVSIRLNKTDVTKAGLEAFRKRLGGRKFRIQHSRKK